MKGCYLLVIENDTRIVVTVGALGDIFFPEGYYVYAGSAMGGLEQRIARHRKKEKKLRWHIDYLLTHTRLIKVHRIVTGKNVECSLARHLALRLESVPGFGCSDCRCKSHLFYHASRKTIETVMSKTSVAFQDKEIP